MKKTGARSAHTTASARGAQPTTAMGERPLGTIGPFERVLSTSAHRNTLYAINTPLHCGCDHCMVKNVLYV
jgi:hypothetical protein